jgi:hypothetical protein
MRTPSNGVMITQNTKDSKRASAEEALAKTSLLIFG